MSPDGVELEAPDGWRTLNSAVLIASGATERVVPLPGWTLPGVVTCSAAQAMLKMHGEVVGRRVLVAGSGPFLLPVAAALIAAGARVPRVVEAQRLGRRAVTAVCSKPEVVREAAGHLWAIASARSRLCTGWAVVRIDQREKGLRVVLAQLEDGGALRPDANSEVVECDAVCLSAGFIPSVGLGQLAGSELRFLPGSRTWGLETTGLEGTAGACPFALNPAGSTRAHFSPGLDTRELVSVRGPALDCPPSSAPWRVRRQLQTCWNVRSPGSGEQLPAIRLRLAVLARKLELACPSRADWYERTTGDVVVCRCENVTAGAIRGADFGPQLKVSEARNRGRSGRAGRSRTRSCLSDTPFLRRR